MRVSNAFCCLSSEFEFFLLGELRVAHVVVQGPVGRVFQYQPVLVLFFEFNDAGVLAESLENGVFDFKAMVGTLDKWVLEDRLVVDDTDVMAAAKCNDLLYPGGKLGDYYLLVHLVISGGQGYARSNC